MERVEKQTAVEWLLEHLEPNILWTDKAEKIAEQAKQMEKEIIRTAYLDDMDGEYNTSEQYYNETFKSE